MAGTTTTPPATPTATTAPSYGVTGTSTPVTNRAQSLLNLRSTKN